MILAHHGGEVPLVLQTLLGAGTVAPVLLLMRERLRAASGRLLRRKSHG